MAQRNLRNVTITVSEQALEWARREAAAKNTSVSKLVGRMIEDKMRLTSEYWQAYERWKELVKEPFPGVDASQRMTREEANVRPKYR